MFELDTHIGILFSKPEQKHIFSTGAFERKPNQVCVICRDRPVQVRSLDSKKPLVTLVPEAISYNFLNSTRHH